jgi:hypothetical protein
LEFRFPRNDRWRPRDRFDVSVLPLNRLRRFSFSCFPRLAKRAFALLSNLRGGLGRSRLSNCTERSP